MASLKGKDHDANANRAKLLHQEGTALQKSDPRAAREKFTEAIALCPSEHRFFAARGNCFRQMGEYKRALFDYTMAIQIRDQEAKYYGNRGVCFRCMGKLEDSIHDFRSAIQLQPHNGHWFYNLGLTYYDMGDKGQALSCYSEAIKFLPEGSRFKSYYHRGNTFREMGDAARAIKDLQQAIKLDDKEPMAQNSLGLAYFHFKNKYKEAAACFSEAVHIDPRKAVFFNNRGLDDNNSAIYFNRGNALLASGASFLECFDSFVGFGDCTNEKFDEALADFDEAISRVPDDENAYYCKGLVFQEMKEVQRAIEQFKLSLAVNPGFVYALFHLGLMYHIDGQLFESMECFNRVLKLDSADRRAYESLGLVYCDLLYYDSAVGAFTKAIRVKDDYAINYFYRGKSLLWLGRYQEAIRDFDRAFALGSDDPQVYSCRAMARKFLRDYDAAIADLGEAIKKDPTNVEYLYNRSQCSLDVEDYASASADLTHAIEINPNEAKLYYLRGLAWYDQREYQLTIQDLHRSLELDPNANDAHDCHYHMGIAFANSGRYTEAIACFSNSMRLKRAPPPAPPLPNLDCRSANTAHYIHERAKAYQNVGKHRESIADFSAVIVLQPTNANAFFRRGFANKALEKFDEAAEDFETARRLEPENPNLVINYRTVHEVEFVELCEAGREPEQAAAKRRAHLALRQQQRAAALRQPSPEDEEEMEGEGESKGGGENVGGAGEGE